MSQVYWRKEHAVSGCLVSNQGFSEISLCPQGMYQAHRKSAIFARIPLSLHHFTGPVGKFRPAWDGVLPRIPIITWCRAPWGLVSPLLLLTPFSVYSDSQPRRGRVDVRCGEVQFTLLITPSSHPGALQNPPPSPHLLFIFLKIQSILDSWGKN